ncbi:MAG: peptidase C15 [Hyphomicrobiales bacterium]|nr:peptidase C15 [Hyphomicrobiales bacterium]
MIPHRHDTTRTANLLVTGFGPFPGVSVNPTAALMERVTKRLGGGSAGWGAAGERLSVSYGRALREFDDSDRLHRPVAVLLLGLAARARWVRVERHARRLDSPLHPDSTGKAGAATAPDSAMPLKATVAPDPALAALRRSGLRARLSPSAGRYLCNAVYARALTRAQGRPVLFIHVPWPRPAAGTVPRSRVAPWRPSMAGLERGLARIGHGLIMAARTRTAQV